MKSFKGSFSNLNFSPSTSILLKFFFPFIDIRCLFLSSINKETSFSKATMVMRFPAKKNAGCPKAPRDFPPRKDGILYPPSGCLGTPLPLPQSLCGRTDGRTYGQTDGHVTITSQPKFLGSIGYQICLAMELRWRALPAGSAKMIVCHRAIRENRSLCKPHQALMIQMARFSLFFRMN